MAEIKNFFNNLKSKIFANKYISYAIVVALLCVVALIFASTVTKKPENKKQQSSNKIVTDSSLSLSYAKQLGNQLEDTINNIKGINHAKVIVVVESSPHINYLNDETSSGKAVVYEKVGTTQRPVASVEISPKITGILVVAKGANNLGIKNNLINAISCVYNVPISCIDILEGK